MKHTEPNDSLTRIGVDTGGTFTDFVALIDGRLHTAKVLSTPDDPSRAIAEGPGKAGPGLGAGGPGSRHHGRHQRGARRQGCESRFRHHNGFRRHAEPGPQNRDRLYSLAQPRVDAPVEESLCLEIDARAAADGNALAEPDADALRQLRKHIEQLAPEAVAVNLLFSWMRPDLERLVRAALPEDLPVSLSSEVLPEIREYERGIATWLNASVGPKLAGYLGRLEHNLAGGRLAVMQSSGLTVSASQASSRAVHLLLSGPAGGLAAAAHIGRELNRERLLSFDMGGTSTDVALLDGKPSLTREGRIGRYPVAVPMVDMHTIGAGGGSIVRVDAGGLIQVGPESAGADPGPVCYGSGGENITVTDANLLLGRLPRETRLGGTHRLDFDAAARAMDELAEQAGLARDELARGVIRIANEHMSRALRVMSAERGIDPKSATLMSFGGAGGLHVCELAESLGMTSAVVPARSGVLSALGMLVAQPGRQATASFLKRADAVTKGDIEAGFEPLVERVRDELGTEGIAGDEMAVERWIDCRYVGQSATLELSSQSPEAVVETFHDAHEQAFGHRLALPVELVGLRVEARGPSRLEQVPPFEDANDTPDVEHEVPVMMRSGLSDSHIEGPAIVMDTDATTWVAEGWQASLDTGGHLLLERPESAD